MPNFNLVAGYSATNWWLRSPNVGNANNVYNVNTTGTLTNNNANNGNGCAPDRKHRQHKVSAEGERLTAPKSVQDCKEPTTSLAERRGNTYRRCRRLTSRYDYTRRSFFTFPATEAAHGIR